MSVNPIRNGPSNFKAPASAKPVAKSAADPAIEEATETAAATRQVAAHGDPVALRKLAKLDAQSKPAPAPAEAKKPGQIDVTG